jgi:hypothetical protein
MAQQSFKAIFALTAEVSQPALMEHLNGSITGIMLQIGGYYYPTNVVFRIETREIGSDSPKKDKGRSASRFGL